MSHSGTQLEDRAILLLYYYEEQASYEHRATTRELNLVGYVMLFESLGAHNTCYGFPHFPPSLCPSRTDVVHRFIELIIS